MAAGWCLPYALPAADGYRGWIFRAPSSVWLLTRSSLGPTPSTDGVRTSLADLGYVSAGVDDGWQACGAGVQGSFHDAEGRPIVNTTRFPVSNNGLFEPFRFKNECVLPRQARDKHGENSTKGPFFLREG